MVNRSWLSLAWRGALSGVIGGAIWLAGVALLSPFTGMYLFLGLIYVIPFTGIVGVVIAGTIWGLHIISGRNIGAFARAFTGVVCAFLLNRLYNAYTQRDYSMFVSWESRMTYLITFSVIVGIVAGLMVGPQNFTKAK